MAHELNMIDYLDRLEKKKFPLNVSCYMIFDHKDFLKSQPQLGDFVPTNEKGEVMEKPGGLEEFRHDTGLEYDEWIFAISDYKNALDRVMWKGWNVGEHGWIVNEFADSIGLVNGSKFVLDSDKTTYNDLITSGVKLERIEKK